MNIIFDIRGTVLAVEDLSPRPYIGELIDELRSCGNDVYFWSDEARSAVAPRLKSEGLKGILYTKDDPLPFTPDLCVEDFGNSLSTSIGSFSHLTVDRHVSVTFPGMPIHAEDILKKSIEKFAANK